ncbi:MAG: hypothetical protein KME49_02195 [Brasilonema octagenarum HA4186-MV1]|nr:hypothetical protein [Brasilonema octagenarum HA4186-MV1]
MKKRLKSQFLFSDRPWRALCSNQTPFGCPKSEIWGEGFWKNPSGHIRAIAS